MRGIAVARELSERFDLHLMHHPGRTAPVVYLTERSQTPDGRGIAVVGAQGDLEFAAAERLLWSIDDVLSEGPATTAAVLLDLHRVTRVHEIAERMIDARLAALVEEDIAVAVVHQESVEAAIGASARFETRAEALAWCQAL